MASDTIAIQTILDDIRASLNQLEQLAVPVRVIEKDGVLWIGLLACKLTRDTITYDSARALAMEVGAGVRATE